MKGIGWKREISKYIEKKLQQDYIGVENIHNIEVTLL